MNNFIGADDFGIEVGAGAGFSREYIDTANYEVTDFADFDWLDRKVDALNLPYEDKSLDFVIESNMLHHLSSPARFFRECHRVLRPGGLILMQDVWGSLLLRFLCRLLRTEGYSYDVDVFDENAACCDSENLWAGNNVIPNLLFRDTGRIRRELGFEVKYLAYSEVVLFPLSGGVTSNIPSPRLPAWLLHLVDRIDRVIAGLAPNACALQMSAVLERK
jgi:SAM-dependent methyltransferase